MVDNVDANGEIAHTRQYSLFAIFFQKSSAEEALESVYIWERLNTYLYYSTLFIMNMLKSAL